MEIGWLLTCYSMRGARRNGTSTECSTVLLVVEDLTDSGFINALSGAFHSTV